ncbi:MAG: hypothetical protein AAFX00_08930 [Pseudomonadota bacterium]
MDAHIIPGSNDSQTLLLNNSGKAATAWTFDQTGKTSGKMTLKGPGNGDFELAILEDGNFVVVWSKGSGNAKKSDVYARVYTPDLQPVSKVTPIDDPSAAKASSGYSIAATPDGGFVVTWTERSKEKGPDPYFHTFAKVFDATGQAVSDQVLVNVSQTAKGGMVAVDGNGTFFWAFDDHYRQLTDLSLLPTVGANTITGTAQDDALFGLDGDDTLNGLEGDDVLAGGTGADVINGGAGIDLASYAFAAPAAGLAKAKAGSKTKGLTVDLADTTQNTGEATGDTYIDVEGILGSDWSDHLFGDARDHHHNGRLRPQ